MDSLEIIKELLAHGANPNQRLTKRIPLRGQPAFDGRWANMAGATPFLRAAQSDDLPIMRLLLANKADGHIQTLDHTTGLMLAAGVGWSDGISVGANSDAPEAMKICLDLGDDVNATNDAGFVALHGAAYRGADDAVRLLVEHGAKIDVKSKDGRTPLNLAEGARFGAGSYTIREQTAALIRQLESGTAPAR